MRQRTLLEDDDEPAPRPRRVESGDDVMALLEQMESVLQFSNPRGPWHARRKGGVDYGHGSTAIEAMKEALKHPLESWRRE